MSPSRLASRVTRVRPVARSEVANAVRASNASTSAPLAATITAGGGPGGRWLETRSGGKVAPQSVSAFATAGRSSKRVSRYFMWLVTSRRLHLRSIGPAGRGRTGHADRGGLARLHIVVAA